MNTNIKAIACGCFHSLFINNKQQLVVVGYNYSGQLGLNQNQTQTQTQTQETHVQTQIPEQGQQMIDNNLEMFRSNLGIFD